MIEVHTSRLQTVIPCLCGVSHLYCKHFQFYQRHLWLIFKKTLWQIAIIDLVDEQIHTGMLQTVISPNYLGCYIYAEHIFNFISAIYDWILKTLIICLKWLSRGCMFNVHTGGLSHSYRNATNSYPPVYLRFHGLCLMSIGLLLGWPQSHHVLYNTIYDKISVLYTSLLDVGEVTITRYMCTCIVRQDYTGADFHLVLIIT